MNNENNNVCPECKGTKKYVGLIDVEPCKACSGYQPTEEDKVLIKQIKESIDKRLLVIKSDTVLEDIKFNYIDTSTNIITKLSSTGNPKLKLSNPTIGFVVKDKNDNVLNVMEIKNNTEVVFFSKGQENELRDIRKKHIDEQVNEIPKYYKTINILY